MLRWHGIRLKIAVNRHWTGGAAIGQDAGGRDLQGAWGLPSQAPPPTLCIVLESDPLSVQSTRPSDSLADGAFPSPAPGRLDDSEQAEQSEPPVASEARWAPLLGLIASVIVHAIFLLLAAMVLLDRAAGPTGHGDGIELAIVTSTELTDLQSDAANSASPSIDAQAPSELLDATLFDTPISDTSLETALSAPSGLQGAGQSLGEGLDLGGGGGLASFFGVEARGTHFAYIVDVSGSMTGAKLKTLKLELSGSVEALSDHDSFFVVFFSSQPEILGGRRKWQSAIRRNKDFAERNIRAVSAGGATNPLPAFEMVFELRPRPDAIYLMTDGAFSPGVIPEIKRMNDAWIEPTPVHAISFWTRDSEAQLSQIAAESGGTYTHIEGDQR